MIATCFKQTWYSRGYAPSVDHPTFFDNRSGKMKRISNAEGIKLIEEGIIPLTDGLKKYYESRGIEIKFK